jgi:methyl-accepting chemotaxis protein
MDEIAKDSQEQASSINDISHSIREMDQMTQHNAALVQETNASINKTEAQAVELDHIVEQFQIGRDKSKPTAKATKPSAPAASAPAQKAAPIPQSAGNTALKADDEDWVEF